MILNDISTGTPVVVLDDVYTDEELNLIWEELAFITHPTRLLPSHALNGATHPDGKAKNTGAGIFLHMLYGHPQFSGILTVNRKLFSKEVLDFALQINPFYLSLNSVNNDTTLVNYYEDTQGYDAHVDESAFTAVTMLHKEPCKFTGGDLFFPDINLVVPNKNNRLVIFAGAFSHAVSSVKMTQSYPAFSGNGRYSITQFLNIK